MKLADFRKDDGYRDEAGCYFDDTEALISTGILGMCGCGDPAGNLEYIRTGLCLIDERLQSDATDRKWWDEYQQRVRAHFGNHLSEQFFYYWLDKEAFTEHGSSIPGWLTEKGRDLAEMLKEWKVEAGWSSGSSGGS